MGRIKLLILFFTFIISYPSISQEILTRAGTKKISQKITEAISKLKFENAFRHIKEIWPVPEEEVEKLKNKTSSQVELFSEVFGKITGLEYIKENHVASSLSEYTYIIKFERHALRLTYTFYKGEDHWILSRFKWDDKIHELFR